MWHRDCPACSSGAMKQTVLVVDDDDSTRFVLAQTLKQLGCRVVSASDGAEVPDLLAQYAFDLLVIDLYMPGMDGFELLRRVRRTTSFLPTPRTSATVRVLVVSGENNPA